MSSDAGSRPRADVRPLLAVALALAACTSSGGPSGSLADASAVGMADAGPVDADGGAGADAGPTWASLRVEPAAVELVHTEAPATKTFAVLGIDSSGAVQDLTARARFRLSDPELGSLFGPTFTTAGRAGSATLVAELPDGTATASLAVRVDRTEDAAAGPPLPADPAGVFADAPADAARPAPEVVYPNPETLLPPNLAGLEVHFRPGDAGNTLFRVRFQGEGLSLRVHTRCRTLGAGCLYVLPPALWSDVAGSFAGRGPIEISVEGTDDQGTARSASDAVAVQVAPRAVEGGLYYWSTSRRAILRVDFGTQGAPEQYWPPPGTSGGPCYGCHALSPDGRRMTLSENGQRDGKLTLLEVATRAPLVRASSAIREQFQSWAPDSARFAAVYGDDDPPSTALRIRSGETGQILETVELGFDASHVDWSPAGDRIAFTRVTRSFTSQRPGRGGIALVERSGDGWSAPIELVAPVDGLNHYTPAFSPDGRFLVYARSECPNGQIYAGSCDGDADPTSKLWAVFADGGAPIPLDRVNAAGRVDGDDRLSNTFPKWAPFVDPLRADRTGRLMWFTFSSRRRYGLRPPVGSNQLLWMVAVDPDAIEAGRDGTYSAFALPFQDLSTSNHIAQWTQRVVPTEPPEQPACSPRGAACDPAADTCCEGLECVPGASGATVCDRLF